MNHAPTPWTATATVIRDANGHSIASAGNNRHNQGLTLIASLRLAAAAPDLLAALDLLMSDPARKGLLTETVMAARAAIAKAKGQP